MLLRYTTIRLSSVARELHLSNANEVERLCGTFALIDCSHIGLRPTRPTQRHVVDVDLDLLAKPLCGLTRM